MSDPQTKLGQLIDGDQLRDAVHIAVAPMRAAMDLQPGQHVGFLESTADTVGGPCKKPIGIVDPFLNIPVRRGQRFWLFLYPNTITSLKHIWTHPAFIADEAVKAPGAVESYEWMASYGSQYGFSGQRMIEAATDYLERGDYFSDGGTFEGESVPDEFWTHYERVTGKVVRSEDRGSFYSCSC